MTVVNPKSISGINSITMASGSDDLLTIHSNNTTERVKVNNSGDVIIGSGVTLSPDGDIFATGITTISENLKVGTGVTISPDGDAFFTGVCTATSFSGDGSNLTGISGVSVANQSDNRLITATGTTDALNGESNVTFDGTTFDINGKFENTAAAGGDYVAKFQNLTPATPYTVQIKEPGSATDGYPLINISNNAADTEYFRVDSGRGVTKLVMHAGAGIDFSAASGSGSGSTSALLDDYEEGTWSPVLQNSSGSITRATYQAAYYVKVGRVVHLYGRMDCDGMSTHLGSVSMHIGGFPFSSGSQGNSGDHLVSVWGGGYNFWLNGYPSISIENNQSRHGLFIHRTSGTNYGQPTGNDLGNNTIQFTFNMCMVVD